MPTTYAQTDNHSRAYRSNRPPPDREQRQGHPVQVSKIKVARSININGLIDEAKFYQTVRELRWNNGLNYPIGVYQSETRQEQKVS